MAVIILISGRANCTSLLMMCLSIISHILWLSIQHGIYAYANQQGSSFEDQYIALLRDTASMTSEELAKTFKC